MAGNQCFKKTFFLANQNDESMQYSVQSHGLSKNLKYSNNYLQQHTQKHKSPRKISQKRKKQSFSLNTSTNQLRDVSNQFQPERQIREYRYFSKMDKRNLESSLEEVSPWNANSFTPKEITSMKFNFSKERQKIKQMIYEYRLSKTIDQSTKQHANFIKSSRSKKKKVNVVLLQYVSDLKQTQRPLSLIKSVDVNKSYENYLSNQFELDKSLFKIPTKIRNSHKKEIFSCRTYTKQTQNEKLISIKEHLTQPIKDDLTYSNYLNQLKNSISRSNLSNENHENQMSIRKKYVQQKAYLLRNERNKKGLKDQRVLRNFRQENHLTSKSKVKQGNPQFSISGNKTHKLQYQQ